MATGDGVPLGGKVEGEVTDIEDAGELGSDEVGDGVGSLPVQLDVETSNTARSARGARRPRLHMTCPFAEQKPTVNCSTPLCRIITHNGSDVNRQCSKFTSSGTAKQ